MELGRIIHLQPMCFLDDWPFIGQDQNGDGIGEPVKEWSVPAEGHTEGEHMEGEHTKGERAAEERTAGEDPAGDVPGTPSASPMILRKRHWGFSGSGRPIPMRDFIP